jgi:hypothetical protein
VNLQELIALWAGAFGCSGDALNLRNLQWEGLFDGNGGIRACRYG